MMKAIAPFYSTLLYHVMLALCKAELDASSRPEDEFRLTPQHHSLSHMGTCWIWFIMFPFPTRCSRGNKGHAAWVKGEDEQSLLGQKIQTIISCGGWCVLYVRQKMIRVEAVVLQSTVITQIQKENTNGIVRTFLFSLDRTQITAEMSFSSWIDKESSEHYTIRTTSPRAQSKFLENPFPFVAVVPPLDIALIREWSQEVGLPEGIKQPVILSWSLGSNC